MIGGGDFDGEEGVGDGAVEGDVAGDNGESLDANARFAQGHDEGDGVVGGGVGVNDEAAHGAPALWGLQALRHGIHQVGELRTCGRIRPVFPILDQTRPHRVAADVQRASPKVFFVAASPIMIAILPGDKWRSPTADSVGGPAFDHLDCFLKRSVGGRCKKDVQMIGHYAEFMQ
jgi:hypothetical protein